MIGVFDSGFGGLTVWKKLIKDLPDYDYLYLGDNARAPYGNKSAEAIYQSTCEALEFLFGQGSELVILACNTASAKALRRVQQDWLIKNYPEKKVLGVLIPACEIAVDDLKNIKTKQIKKVGVIGTRATIESGAYEQEFKKIAKENNYEEKFEIVSTPAPLLVPLIEEGWIKRPETKMILKKYLHSLKTAKVNALILGCTHYPFLLKDFKRIMGKNIFIIDSPGAVSKKFIDYLQRHPEIEKKLSKNKKRLVYTTDNPDKFIAFAKKYIGEEVKAKQIIL